MSLPRKWPEAAPLPTELVINLATSTKPYNSSQMIHELSLTHERENAKSDPRSGWTSGEIPQKGMPSTTSGAHLV